MSKTRFTRAFWYAAAAASAFVAAAPAFAQETTPDAQAAEEERSTTIIVTAQKREESIQDVPISVTAFDSQLLQESGVKDIKDLIQVAPSLMVTSTSNEANTTARIRGIGTVGDNPGLESSVGISIDGVYRPRNGVGFGDLGEIERIELLRGPQGTLFGKNTSAGIISVITREPSFDFGVNGELTMGDYDLLTAAGSVTGPLVEDKAAYRLFAKMSRRDGYVKVDPGVGLQLREKDRDQDSNYAAFRGQLLLTPNDNLRVRAIVDAAERKENCCAAVQLFTGPTSAFIDALAGASPGINAPIPASRLTAAPQVGFNRLVPANPFERRAYSDASTESNTKEAGASVQVDYSLPFADFTYIGAMRTWENQSAQDVDFSAAAVAYRTSDPALQGNKFDFFSHEARLQGELGIVNWMVGAFLASEQLERKDAQLYGAAYEQFLSLLLSGGTNPSFVNLLTGLPAGRAYPVGTGTRDVYSQEADTWALFTHNQINLTDKLELTLGLRYTAEDKSAVATFQTESSACRAILTAAATPTSLLNLAVPAASRPTVIGNICAPWANFAADTSNFDQKRSENEWSGTARATYKFTDDVSVFGGYSRGYKGGGFNLDRAPAGIGANPPGFRANSAFPAEFVDTYEVGLKSSWFDNALLVNATAFSSEFENFQLNTFTGIQFIVTPIREVKSQGFEIDTVWIPPVDGFYIQGGVAYADTTYGDNIRPTGSVVTDVTLPGSQLSLSPKWYVSGSVSYERPVFGNFKFKSNVGGRWVSEYNTGSDLLVPKMQDAFALFNARIGIGADDDRWALELWSQNITDEDYIQVGFNAPLQGSSGITSLTTPYNPLNDTITYNAFLGAPRTFGATLRFQY